MSKPPREILNAIHKHLSEHPDEWAIDGFNATHHKLAVEIWHENRYYGVSLKVGGAKWGGTSTFFGWGTGWRRNLCEIDRISVDRFIKKIAAEAQP